MNPPPVATPRHAAAPAAPVTALLRRQIVDIWNDGDIDAVDEVYAETIVDHMPVAGQPGGRAGLKAVVQSFRTALPDLRMHLHGTIACGDIGVDFWTLEGTHLGPLAGHPAPATGNRVRFSGIDMVRVRDDRIAEVWHFEEMLQFFGQLGEGEVAFGRPVEVAPILLDRGARDPGARAALPDLAHLTPLEIRNLQIARDHIERIWARGDWELAHRLYAADVVDHNPAPDQRPGIDGIVDVLGWLREAVPDLEMSIESYVVEGDLAADRWTMRGTHTGAPLLGFPPRGRRFEFAGMDVIRIRDDGQISDVWHVEDFLALRAQLAD